MKPPFTVPPSLPALPIRSLKSTRKSDSNAAGITVGRDLPIVLNFRDCRTQLWALGGSRRETRRRRDSGSQLRCGTFNRDEDVDGDDRATETGPCNYAAPDALPQAKTWYRGQAGMPQDVQMLPKTRVLAATWVDASRKHWPIESPNCRHCAFADRQQAAATKAQWAAECQATRSSRSTGSSVASTASSWLRQLEYHPKTPNPNGQQRRGGQHGYHDAFSAEAVIADLPGCCRPRDHSIPTEPRPQGRKRSAAICEEGATNRRMGTGRCFDQEFAAIGTAGRPAAATLGLVA